MEKIIIIPDSFKGSLSSKQVADIMTLAIKKYYPLCQIKTYPIADGGEGTVDCFLDMWEGKKITLHTKGPHMNDIVASYALIEKTAVIEVAQIVGLPMTDPLDPTLTTTYGLGEVIKDAISKGATTVMIGLGGSSTNDAGIGMALALGAKFYNQEDEMFQPTPLSLSQIKRINLDKLNQVISGINFVGICDVENPLYGLLGAAYVYSPQKGATKNQVVQLDKELKAFAQLIQNEMQIDLQSIKGTGAAGGLGAAIITFLSGTLKPGIDTILELNDVAREIRNADLIITGEGKIDEQSSYGKAIAGIAKLAKKHDVPLLAICGSIGDHSDQIYEMGVSAIFSINKQAMDFNESKALSEENLRYTTEQIMRYTKSLQRRKK